MNYLSLTACLETLIFEKRLSYQEKQEIFERFRSDVNRDVIGQQMLALAQERNLNGYMQIVGAWNNTFGPSAQARRQQTDLGQNSQMTAAVPEEPKINDPYTKWLRMSSGAQSNTAPSPEKREEGQSPVEISAGRVAESDEISTQNFLSARSEKLDGDVTYHPDPEDSLEKILDVMDRGDRLLIAGCIRLYLVWEKEGADLYEFLDEVIRLRPQTSRRWIQQWFHIGEVIVQVGRKAGMEADWIAVHPAFQSMTKWLDVYELLEKRTVQRRNGELGRPMQILNPLDDRLIEPIRRAVIEGSPEPLLIAAGQPKRAPANTAARKTYAVVKFRPRLREYFKEGTVVVPEDPEERKKFLKQLRKDTQNLEVALSQLRNLANELQHEALSPSTENPPSADF